jgi:hypothetical protein
MKAVVYNGPRNITVEDVPDAKIERASIMSVSKGLCTARTSPLFHVLILEIRSLHVNWFMFTPRTYAARAAAILVGSIGTKSVFPNHNRVPSGIIR